MKGTFAETRTVVVGGVFRWETLLWHKRHFWSEPELIRFKRTDTQEEAEKAMTELLSGN